MMVLNIGDIIRSLKEVISQSGMEPPDEIPTGEIVRFSDDGKKNKNGWCILFVNSGGSGGGCFGSWRTGLNEKWFYNEGNMTQAERNILGKQIQEAQERDQKKLIEKQAQAAKKANELWSNAQPANPNHDYLLKKQIRPYGLKQSGKALLVPVLDEKKLIISLQMILPEKDKKTNKDKKFMPGGRVKSGFYSFGNPGLGPIIYIGEGYATMASVHAATSKPCVISFNSGNLKRVAEIIKEQYPDKTIIICSDNDISTKEKTGKNPGLEAAEQAANTIGAELCICPMDSDFNDLHVKHGLDAVKKALEKIKKPKIEQLPLQREVEQAEPYPFKSLGETIGGAAQAMFDGIQAPDGLCAQAALGFATHAVQGHANVIVDGRSYPLNEFYLSIGSRSARKSACDEQAGRTHKDEQRLLLKQFYINRKAFNDEMEAYKKEREKLLNDKKTTHSDKSKALAELRKDEPIAPHEPLIMFSDPTIEGIHGLFLNGTPSKFLCADEGGQVSGGHSMTAEKKVYTATTYSKYWDGAPIDRVRGGDGSSVLYGRRLAMHLMMQDQIAAEFFNDPIMRNQGLMSRFLISSPGSLKGSRHYKAYNVAETSGMMTFYEQIKRSLDTPLPLRVDQDTEEKTNELEPRTIFLDDDAKDTWILAYEEIEAESGPGGLFEQIEGFAGKAANHIVRLSGIMALLDDIDRKTIPMEYVGKAINLIMYYLNERLRLAKMSEPNQALEQAKTLLGWIQEKGLKIVTLPDVYQNGPSRFRTKKQAQDSIDVLVNHNWLFHAGSQTSEISGKKSNDTWSVNDAKI